MTKIDLGIERPDYSSPMPESPKPKKMKTIYPQVTIEKDLGIPVKFGKEFKAEVTFKIVRISDGENYEGDKRRTEVRLEVISIEPKSKMMSRATRRDEDGSESQNAIADALEDRVSEKED